MKYLTSIRDLEVGEYYILGRTIVQITGCDGVYVSGNIIAMYFGVEGGLKRWTGRSKKWFRSYMSIAKDVAEGKCITYSPIRSDVGELLKTMMMIDGE